ncbi:MAG: ABC transporter ATP-binding protein/permease [Clostridia bacterium]|nr:ABC transporter ATP-binding protein/permease [Clostridia bacterium]
MPRNRFAYSIPEMTKRLLAIAGTIRWHLLGSVLASVAGNLGNLGLMGFGAMLILRAGGLVPAERGTFYTVMLILSAIAVPAGRYLEGLISHIGAYTMLAEMRITFYKALRSLAPAYLMDRRQGDIMNIAVSDIETIEFFFAHLLGPFFTILILPIVTILLAAHYAGLYVLAILPVYLVTSFLLPVVSMKLGRGVGMRYRQALAQVKALVLESVYGIRDIEIFGCANERLAMVEDANRQVNRAAHGLTLHRQATTSAPTFFVYLTRILILAAASSLAASGKGDPAGTVLISLAAVATFSSTFSLNSVITNLMQTYAAAERLFLIEDRQPSVTDPAQPVPCGPIRTIDFENVRFRYAEDRPWVLDGFTLHLTAGEKLGIAGESGIGKSTVLRLLLRFWDPQEGRILLNGIDIRRIALSELRSRIAVLEQDTFLFDDTIAANIAFGRPDATQEEIETAAKGAGIHDFIRTLPQGYETPMGQMAARLSGGERQRVGIARCLLAAPDMIAMDEPTSSLDVFHEKELLGTLAGQYPDKTMLIISHRMSTLSVCSRLERIAGGKLAGPGVMPLS